MSLPLQYEHYPKGWDMSMVTYYKVINVGIIFREQDDFGKTINSYFQNNENRCWWYKKIPSLEMKQRCWPFLLFSKHLLRQVLNSLCQRSTKLEISVHDHSCYSRSLEIGILKRSLLHYTLVPLSRYVSLIAVSGIG